jgi:TrmH family RNA methyltransferase
MQRVELVSSLANPLIKDVRFAVFRGDLTRDGLWIAEGFHLLDEALRSACEVRMVLVSESAQSKLDAGLQTRVVVLPDKLLQTIAATETTQGLIALVKPPEWRVDDLFGARSLIAVLDGLQDPGNAGAIVRAAEAFGATGVMFLKGSAGPFHPKTLRGSAGSLFRVPFLCGMDPARAIAALQEHGVEIYAAMPGGAGGIGDFTRACAIVVGNEGRGVSEDFRRVASDVGVPTVGVESLNAAMAASILLYEARRQRR